MNDSCLAIRLLTPSEYSSGDTICKGHITHQGNTRVRHLLGQAAWRAIEKDRDLREFFERLYPRTGKKRAIVAVARKLIGRIRAAFKTGQPYQMNPLIPQTVGSFLNSNNEKGLVNSV